MARGPNDLPTETFTVSTTPQIVEELKVLVRTGHFGKNHADAAERIISTELHKLFGDEAFANARTAPDAGKRNR